MDTPEDNPYRSPKAHATVEFDESSPRDNRSPKKKGMIDVLFLIFGTSVGGLLGNAFGTVVARLLGLGMPIGPVFQMNDLLVITHPIGLALLFIGSLIGAYVGNRCGAIVPEQVASMYVPGKVDPKRKHK